MREWIKAIPVAVGLPVVIGAASVKPEDAASNLAAWAHMFGFEQVPDWLANPSADHRVILAAFGVSAIYAVAVWGIPAYRMFFEDRRELSQPEASTSDRQPDTSPILLQEQIRLLNDIDDFIGRKDENGLRELFDFPKMWDFNIKFVARDIRRAPGCPLPRFSKNESDDIDDFFKGGQGVISLRFATHHVDDAGNFVPQVIPGKIGILNTSKKYQDSLRKLSEYASAALLPAPVKVELDKFRDTVMKNQDLMFDIINDSLTKSPFNIAQNDEAGSRFYGATWNPYWTRFRPLRSAADEVTAAIRACLLVR